MHRTPSADHTRIGSGEMEGNEEIVIVKRRHLSEASDIQILGFAFGSILSYITA
jgi:hypothetical protein